jgi:molybdate transport system substrate-binding protein
MATRGLLADLAAQFGPRAGAAVELVSIGGVDAARRVAAGEAFDGVVLAADAIDKLIAAGHAHAPRLDLVRSGVAAAVRAGAPQPDIASEDALRDAVLGAASVGYSTGPSGTALLQLFDRWGIAAQLEGRLVQAPPGVPVGSLVADGRVELGFQQLSELMHLPGITLLGELPEPVQIVTTFTAAATARAGAEAAEALARLLSAWSGDDAAAAIKRRHGMAPA